MIYDRLNNETLKEIISEVEQRFGANDSSDKAFDELFKLIFTKLYDEKISADDADAISNQMRYGNKSLKEIDDRQFRTLEFRAKEQERADDVYKNISDLYERAKKKMARCLSVQFKTRDAESNSKVVCQGASKC